MTERVCAVAGVGPGNGTALSKKFAAEGYRVAMLARSEDRLRRLEEEIPSARGYPVDIGDRGQVRSTIERIGGELGPVEVLVHNAAAGAFNSFLDAEPATLELTVRTNVLSLLHLGQARQHRGEARRVEYAQVGAQHLLQVLGEVAAVDVFEARQLPEGFDHQR